MVKTKHRRAAFKGVTGGEKTATTAKGKGEAPSTLRGFNNLETVTISEI